jgi:hypothetical protein
MEHDPGDLAGFGDGSTSSVHANGLTGGGRGGSSSSRRDDHASGGEDDDEWGDWGG